MAKTKNESRICDLCGYDVGSGDMGAHKRGPRCSARRSMMDKGFVELDSGDPLIRLLLAEAAVKTESSWHYDGKFVPAWADRAIKFYRAQIEASVVRLLKRGQGPCEADMAAAMLRKMGTEE